MPTQTPVPVAPPTYTADPSIPFRDRIPHRPNSGDIIDRRTPPAYSFGPGDQASLVGGWPEPTPAPFDYGPAPAGFPSWDEWSTAWNGYWNGPTDQSTGARWLPQWMVNEFSLPTTDGAWVRDIDRNHGLAEYWDGSSWSPFRYDV